MHEISLVRNIFRTLESNFSFEELEKINAIDLKVGLLSNVEPMLMQSAFEAVVSAEGKFQNTKLNILLVPILVHCTTCDQTSEIKEYNFVCTVCGKPNNNVVQGTELLIERVHFN
ncbi:hydrogenase maturation nickel metallochaperone HypA/HybF [Thermoflexibacter ruber]|uniref:Hydrogenase maturation factor HypA n=1 Tax=Thermoflexibacter ruber TaxID=1003 RepID=A0A1I2B0Y9_9BACT|nr:hydrogenase maturation nickel metallochaperone HypA [Thermoflexibacter ruber]SFE49568.1 hydrogenase nickel incorporation protein HypA/HybF [Thermoflexibacter ruber]